MKKNHFICDGRHLMCHLCMRDSLCYHKYSLV